MRDQIISFLAQGFSKASILSVVGCSETLYDDILKQESFASDLAKAKEESRQERIEAHYSALEENTLKILSKEIQNLEAPQLCRVLETISKNKIAYRKPVQTLTHPTAQISVTMNVPNLAVNQKVVLDSNNQVVAIGERIMAPLPLDGVKDLFSKLETKKLPAPASEMEELTAKELRHDLFSETSAA